MSGGGLFCAAHDLLEGGRGRVGVRDVRLRDPQTKPRMREPIAGAVPSRAYLISTALVHKDCRCTERREKKERKIRKKDKKERKNERKKERKKDRKTERKKKRKKER